MVFFLAATVFTLLKLSGNNLPPEYLLEFQVTYSKDHYGQWIVKLSVVFFFILYSYQVM